MMGPDERDKLEASAWAFLSVCVVAFGVVFVGLCVATVLLSGCATVSTQFSETVTDPDGTSTTTQYEAVSTAPPFGKLDTTGHQWVYDWGGDVNHIGTGQDAAGVDNTGWSVIIPLFETLVNAIGEGYKASLAVPDVPDVPPINVTVTP